MRPRRRTCRRRARCTHPPRCSHALRARRRLPPHAARALLAPTSRSKWPAAPRTRASARDAPRASRQRASHESRPRRRSRRHRPLGLSPAATHSRSLSAASAAAARRASAPRVRQPPLLRLTASRPRARAAPTAPEPAGRVDETRGLAAARADAERAVRSHAHALALFERCVSDRRTPRKRSSRPPAAPPAADCISTSSPRCAHRARARRASR